MVFITEHLMQHCKTTLKFRQKLHGFYQWISTKLELSIMKLHRCPEMQKLFLNLMLTQEFQTRMPIGKKNFGKFRI